MIDLTPISQKDLFGLNEFLKNLVSLHKNDKLPNKILLSGQKGLGKATMAYHFINYVLSIDEKFSYDIQNFKINDDNQSFKTILNKSNPNFFLIDINADKKFIDINQIRDLISKLNKSTFNNKPRFILVDNIEFLNLNSVNALLKILEEPSTNTYFILINNNNKNIIPTLKSRCINFNISLSNKENLEVVTKLLDEDIDLLINKDLLNYYLTPGNIYNLNKFAKKNKYDLRHTNLNQFLKIIINNHHYKKDDLIKVMIFDFIESYFIRINQSFSSNIYNKYNYFLKRISDLKKFNLDDESFFLEFEEEILNG